MEHNELLFGLVPVVDKGQELIPHKDYEIKQDGKKFYLVKKKNEYPKTYEECLNVLGYDDRETYCVCHTYANERLFESLYRLKVCRDAYWKIAGKEMGLWKPWEPDWTNFECDKFCIWVDVGDITLRDAFSCQHILAFPTPEMRDAFYENFDPDIEFCKELL